jgi:hypothetical protein
MDTSLQNQKPLLGRTTTRVEHSAQPRAPLFDQRAEMNIKRWERLMQLASISAIQWLSSQDRAGTTDNWPARSIPKHTRIEIHQAATTASIT